MTPLRRISARAVVALAAAALMAIMVITPAAAAADAEAAYPTAYLTKRQYLTANPVDSMPTSCVSRRIFLAAGTYEWGDYFDGDRDAIRNIQLGRDNYTWRSCLDPKNGYYRHTDSLDPDNPAWVTAVWNYDYFLYFNGTYTWGSYLDPQF